MVIAVWAVFVTKERQSVSPLYSFLSGRGVCIPLFEFGGILAEALLALFACKDLFPGTNSVSPGLAGPLYSEDHIIIPSPGSSVAYATPAPGGIRRSQTISGLVECQSIACQGTRI